MNGEFLPVTRAEVSAMLSSFAPEMSDEDKRQFNSFVALSAKLGAGTFDGELLCVWGLMPSTLLSDQVYLWLHTTKAAEQHQFILVRRCQIEIEKALIEYPRIVGHCDRTADRSIRWLKWLGAQFGEPEGKLIPFIIRGKNG